MASKKIRKIWSRFYGRCQYCNVETTLGGSRSPSRATLDHRMPLSRGGGSEADNLVLSCALCNAVKGASTDVEFREQYPTKRALHEARSMFRLQQKLREERRGVWRVRSARDAYANFLQQMAAGKKPTTGETVQQHPDAAD